MRVSGVVASAGLFLTIAAPNLKTVSMHVSYEACMALVYIGSACTGMGLSTLIPTVFSTAGHLPGVHPGTAIATVAFFAYSGSIVGPPLIGGLSTGFESLALSLAVASVLISTISFLSVGILPESDTKDDTNGTVASTTSAAHETTNALHKQSISKSECNERSGKSIDDEPSVYSGVKSLLQPLISESFSHQDLETETENDDLQRKPYVASYVVQGSLVYER